MLTRRSFISASAGFASAWSLPHSAFADFDPKTLTSAEGLAFTTAFLTNDKTYGTGFFYDFLRGEKASFPAIVSNKHVFDAFDGPWYFNMTGQKQDGSPDRQNHLRINVQDTKQFVIPHPQDDVDLAILPIGGAVAALPSPPFWVRLNSTLIPTAAEIDQLDVLEPILTVGYPGGAYDAVNNAPMFHQGSTASAPNLDFLGKKMFAVDFTTWPGSSGSPIFLYHNGMNNNARTHSVSVGDNSIKLLGIADQVATYGIKGDIVDASNTIINSTVHALSQIPINDGICLKSSLLLDFEKEMLRRGFVAPASYNG